MFRGERIAGLDNWRAVLMLAGLLLHATTVQEAARPALFLIADISANFRMGAFFAVAGMLSVFSVRKHGPRTWLSRRWWQIGVPAAFGLLVLGPIMSTFFTWRVLGSVEATPQALGWWHYWFLVALLIYAPITWWLCQPARAESIFGRVDRWVEARRPSAWPIILGVGLTACAIVSLIRLLPPQAGPLGEVVWGVRTILMYAPLYLFGVLLGGSPALFARLTERVLPALSIIFALLLARVVFRATTGDEFIDAPHGPLDILTASLCPPAITILILRSAMGVRETPPIFRRLAEAALTMYMVHYPIILAIDALLDPLGLDPHLSYVLNVSATAWLSYMTHRLIVRRSGIAAVLLNGARLQPRTRATS